MRPPTRRRSRPEPERREPVESDWLVVSDGSAYEHFLPGDEQSGHNLDPDCHCRPSLGEDAQTHAPILMHRSLP